MFKKEELKQIPNNPGVYLFKDKKGSVIYVGKALNLKERIGSYFLAQTSVKNELLVRDILNYSIIEVSSEVEALILEANLIKKYKPHYNISLKDDKSFLYIVITDEKFPRLLPIRKNANVPIKYLFGPFPSSKTVRSVLKLIRKVFSYCTQSPKLKKACFYSHIKLCNPCPGYINKTSGQKYLDLRKQYKTNISYIKRFLEGNFNNLRGDLEKTMKSHSKNQEFEKAKSILNKIKQINYITHPYYKISSFLENPNFMENERRKSLTELYDLLSPHYKSVNNLDRIEGLDISNISGKLATGSLVVFLNGEKQSSLYKRFRIITKGPNDVSMIEELMTRRLKHKEWTYPDLILVDGGKPQVAKVADIISKYKLSIPVIGLSKRLETIVIPTQTSFMQINLKRNSLSLRLIQEIRDEAHRFSRSYHHLLVQKLYKQ